MLLLIFPLQVNKEDPRIVVNGEDNDDDDDENEVAKIPRDLEAKVPSNNNVEEEEERKGDDDFLATDEQMMMNMDPTVRRGICIIGSECVCLFDCFVQFSHPFQYFVKRQESLLPKRQRRKTEAYLFRGHPYPWEHVRPSYIRRTDRRGHFGLQAAVAAASKRSSSH